jgi:putative phage-type endonuclease
MKFVNFTQGSPEWIEWRRAGIGSSDIATIMGSNPYATPYTLWEEKCGRSKNFEGNQYTEFGKKWEPIAVEKAALKLECVFNPVCVEDEISIFKASLDGYDAKHKIVLEIKSPATPSTLEKAKDPANHERWIMQLQWSMGIVGAEKGYLGIWDVQEQEVILFEHFPDRDLFLIMQKRAQEFWEHVKCFTSPEHSSDDYVEVESEELKELLIQYESVTKDMRGLKEKQDELKASIVEYGDDGNFKCGHYKICRTAPRKSYDLEKMKEDGIDIEKYLKPPGIGFYRIMCPK